MIFSAMKRIIFEIVGLRYHDYKDRLPELFAMALGKEIVLSVEEDNVGEANAIAAFLGPCCVGFVRSGQRPMALAALHSCGEEELLATVVDVDSEYAHLYVEVMVHDDLQPETEVEPNVLTHWTYDGPKLISNRSEVSTLKVCASMLQKLLKANPEHWTEYMEDYLTSMERLLVYDISEEMDTACTRLDEMLTALSVCDASFRKPLLRLQYAVRELASKSQREVMANAVRELAMGKEMDKLLERLGDEAQLVAAKLPKPLRIEMHNDLGMLMTHLRYWRQPRVKIQQVRCLLALNLRLESNSLQPEPIIPDALADWAVGDEQKTLMVEQYAKDQLLKKAAPDVLQKITKLKDSCRHKKEDKLQVTYNIDKVDTLAPSANMVTNNHHNNDNG